MQICPKCDSPDFEATTMGIIGIGARDTNKARCCNCGWKGEVWITSIAGLLFLSQRVCSKHKNGTLNPEPSRDTSINELQDLINRIRTPNYL